MALSYASTASHRKSLMNMASAGLSAASNSGSNRVAFQIMLKGVCLLSNKLHACITTTWSTIPIACSLYYILTGCMDADANMRTGCFKSIKKGLALLLDDNLAMLGLQSAVQDGLMDISKSVKISALGVVHGFYELLEWQPTSSFQSRACCMAETALRAWFPSLLALFGESNVGMTDHANDALQRVRTVLHVMSELFTMINAPRCFDRLWTKSCLLSQEPSYLHICFLCSYHN